MITLNDFLIDRRTDLMIRDYWKVTFCFDDLGEETSIYRQVTLGFCFGEYSYEDFPFNKYYKRYGNLIKNIPTVLKNKEVKSIEIGCSGRCWQATYSLTGDEMNTIDKFFNIVK